MIEGSSSQHTFQVHILLLIEIVFVCRKIWPVLVLYVLNILSQPVQTSAYQSALHNTQLSFSYTTLYEFHTIFKSNYQVLGIVSCLVFLYIHQSTKNMRI